MAKVNSWWAGYEFFGTPSFILASKLKALSFKGGFEALEQRDIWRC